jgi:hypothetical protein
LFDGLQSTTSNGWQFFQVEVSGNGGTTPSATQFNQSTAYIRLSFLLNWGSGGTPQQHEIAGVKFSEVAAGATRAVAGMDSSGQLKSSANNNPTNANGSFTGSNPLSQSGTSTTILVSASTIKYGHGNVSYAAGSVDPGSLGAWIVYARDPKFKGGVVAYLATSTKSDLTGHNDIILFGSITTTSGGGSVGVGDGGSVGCFSGAVRVRIRGGMARFDELPAVCEIETLFGYREADLQIREYSGPVQIIRLPSEYVTPEHPINKLGLMDALHVGFDRDDWVPASEKWQSSLEWSGTVYTLSVRTEIEEERHFILEDGTIAHNVSNLT